MGKNYYYLIARNRDTNKAKAINYNGKYGLLLEEVDLLTTQYDSLIHFKNDLFCEGFIDRINTDLFLVHSFRGEIFYTELIFHNRKEIRTIASSYLNKNRDDTLENRDMILNAFCRKMGNDSNYYDFVMYKKHNISPKFVKFFSNSRYKVLYENKYRQGGWARNSYSLIRNILESYDRYDKVRDYCSTDFIEREKIKDILLEITNSDYAYYDGSLFDFQYVKKK